MGRPPPMTTARIPYDVIERLNNLKKHKDEPMWRTVDRACTALEEKTDMEESLSLMRSNMPKIQKRLTEKSTDVFAFLECMPKEVLMDMLSEKNRSRFSEETIIEIRKVISTEKISN